MGWKIKIKEDESDIKYRIWSTISDEYITNWLDKKGIQRFLFIYRLNIFVEAFVKDAMTFPCDYTNKDTGKRIAINLDEREEYYKLLSDSYKTDDDLLTKKFNNIIDAIGISVEITEK